MTGAAGAMPGSDPLVAYALNYASRGFAVLPLHSIRADGRCSCGSTTCSSPGKHPRNERGLSEASKDATIIRAWWTRWPDANIGICTGAISGFIAIDIDPRHYGDASLAEFESRHGLLPPTLRVNTGGGGQHILFQHDGVETKNRANLLPGIDVRGDGGYIVAAPSLHVSGNHYQWQDSDADLAPIPPSILVLLRKPKVSDPPPRGDRARSTDDRNHPYVRAAVDDELEELRFALESGRNNQLNDTAFQLAMWCAGGWIDEAWAQGEIRAVALGVGLYIKEIDKTLRSGWTAGMRKPRNPPEQNFDRVYEDAEGEGRRSDDRPPG